jgi:TonB family protein
MPTIIASLVLSLVFFQAPDKEKKTDLEYDELNGPVRLVRIETEYLAGINEENWKDGLGSIKHGERVLTKITLYDINGRKSEEVSFNRSRCAKGRHIFSYDDKNNRTESVFWGQSVVTGKPDNSQAAGSPLIFKQAFRLDDSGRPAEIQESDSSGILTLTQFYKYDDKGRVKELAVADNDLVNSRCEFKYNDDGLPVEEICNGKGFVRAAKKIYTYKYDGSGNWIKKIESSTETWPNGSLHRYQTATYREIKLYSSKLAAQKDTEDSIDSVKLKPCLPRFVVKTSADLQESAIKRLMPSYPPDAKAAGISGSVVVELTVNEIGKVISVRTVSGPAKLRAASEEAARGWEFRPTLITKVPAKVIGTIVFNYNR